MADVTPEQLTRVYIKMRDKLSELTSEYKSKHGELKAQQDKIARALLDFCKEQDINSSNTSAGTFTRSIKTRYWTSDWEEMNTFIIEHDLPEFFTKSLNQTNVRDYLKANPNVMPKGLNVDTEYVISVRKPTVKQGA